jgi:1-acyl-sn-glycerol-3-phosphate acyltransferase
MLTSLIYLIGIGKRINRARENGDIAEEKRQIRRAESRWIDKFFTRYNITVVVEGEENLIAGPFLAVSNHQSYSDIPILMKALGNEAVGFVARADLQKLPLYGKWIARVRSIFIQRTDSRQALRTYKEGEELLRQGFSLAIFPEGTRSRGKNMAEFMRGTLRMAKQTGVPILPITISGAHKIFEDEGYLQSASVKVCIHKPINTYGWDRKDEENAKMEIEDIIRRKLLEYQTEI